MYLYFNEHEPKYIYDVVFFRVLSFFNKIKK